ncbi:MAG TPA: hypothetical protein VGH28_15015 [Polyangiaceae bacterium]
MTKAALVAVAFALGCETTAPVAPDAAIDAGGVVSPIEDHAKAVSGQARLAQLVGF